MQTPSGKTVLGIYDRPAPPDTALSSRELSSDVTPWSGYNEGVRRALRLGRWLTSASDHLEQLLS